ncbi:MAG: DUF3800 domain-containing protein [Egibacteraceae bacterium]
MLVFIDESGHPNPGDPCSRPVLLAVCVKELDAGWLIRRLYALRRDLLGSMKLSKAEEELKAVEMLNRRALHKNVAKKEFIEALFEFLRDFDLTVFAIVMERPLKPPYRGPEILPRQYWWLLERVNHLIENDHPTQHAVVVFDGQDPASNKLLSDRFTSFMARTSIGRSMSYIVPSPLFADSSLTPGLQIADLFAYVVRLYYEHNLRSEINPVDPYLSCIARYGRVIHEKTANYERGENPKMYGIRTMSADRFVYDLADVKPQLAGAEESE